MSAANIPQASLYASSDGSGGHSLLLIILVVIGVLWIASLFAGVRPQTVVIVEKQTSALAVLLVLGAGLGLLYLLMSSSSGSF